MNDKTKKIAELNDRCRQGMGTHGLVVRTPGIAALPLQDQVSIWQRVSLFDDFSEDNDPYAKRDFGAFEHGGDKVFWKIDYYNLTLTAGSRDPPRSLASYGATGEQHLRFLPGPLFPALERQVLGGPSDPALRTRYTPEDNSRSLRS